MIAIEVDKLTNSIEEVATGISLETVVLPAVAAELKTTLKKNGWLFDWRAEARQPHRMVYKLGLAGNPAVVQGLVSLEVRADHVRLHLVESAPANKGKNRLYAGVAGNLFAFACKLAYAEGHDGNVAFVAKTQLITHYTQSLGAIHFGGHLMVLQPPASAYLVRRYFKESLL